MTPPRSPSHPPAQAGHPTPPTPTAPPPGPASPSPPAAGPPPAPGSPSPPAAGPLPPGVEARAPAAADADALRALVAACDRSYLGWAPAGWTPPAVSTDWSARLGEPGRWSLCAFAGEDLVAYACFRPARHEPAPGAATGPPLPGLAHVAALYVHPTRWRHGIGTAMLARAEAEMRDRGYNTARLWTPEGAPAERFYAAHGWRRDGRSGWDGWLGLQMVGYAKRL